MATTTNYGWTTPDDTDLVKDGAAAIRTLGSSVDTTTKALNPSTTEGDIEYRSATANTNSRLAIGTAGQVLTVNSGEDAPEWATPAAVPAGLDLITTATFSAVAAVSINDVFTSTYENYRVIVKANCSSNDQAFRFRLRASGTDNSSANYMWGLNGLQLTGQATYNETINGSLDGSFKTGAIGTNYRTILAMDIQSPQVTDNTGFTGMQFFPVSATNAYTYQLGGMLSVTTSYDGVTFFPSGGTISGEYWIYGYKKA
jgi:hypothetical protein